MITAQQIVQDACIAAKCPNYLQLGGRKLNLVLNDLVLHRDLQMNRVTIPINVSAASNGPFNLAADYLRTYDLFYFIPITSPNAGLPQFLDNVGLRVFDSEFKDPSIANYPYEFATDLSPQATQQPGLLYIYPQTSGSVTLTHRYMINRADIVTPESSGLIPWFPDQDYLVKATAVHLMEITDDSRHDAWVKQCEDMLRTHLIMEGDEQGTVHEVRLDPRRFKSNKVMRPTKVTD